MTKCIRCWVSGHVQGVFYRGTTQSQAQQLGITGYARNLSDGRVEVLACGDTGKVELLKDWLWQGPRLAEVSDVQCQTTDVEPDPMPTSFSTR